MTYRTTYQAREDQRDRRRRRLAARKAHRAHRPATTTAKGGLR